MDLNKVLVNTITTPIPTSKDDYSLASTYMYSLVDLKENYQPYQNLEFRSKLLTPVLSMKKLIEAICDSKNNGGYEVILDPEFFSPDNKYYNDAWVTLPHMDKIESKNETKTISNNFIFVFYVLII